MRIIQGRLGGQIIHPPKWMPLTRPTTQIAKQGLFNTLDNYFHFEHLHHTLDLFSGTGAISYELASRGAKHLTLIEKDDKMFQYITNNLNKYNITNAHVLKTDVFHFLKNTNQKFDFVFAGPPYMLDNINMLAELVLTNQCLNTPSIFVLEHTPKHSFDSFPLFRFAKHYGTTIFSFFIQQ